jgi:hypothetical protein
MVWPMQRWRLCQRCAGVLASIALASLPALHCCCCQHSLVWSPLSQGHHHPHCAGAIALVTPMLPPASQTGVCPVRKQLQHFGISGIVARCCARRCSPATWPLVVRLMQRWHFCQHCAGVLAYIVLVSLPACAVVIVGVALALLPLSCRCLCPHCTHIVTSIANWHLPSHDAVATHRRMCCHGCALCRHPWLCCCNQHPSTAT